MNFQGLISWNLLRTWPMAQSRHWTTSQQVKPSKTLGKKYPRSQNNWYNVSDYSLTKGYPILPQFDPFPVAGPKRGVSSVNFYSTVAVIEVQFASLTMDSTSLSLDTQYLVMPNNWVSNTLWVNTNCFTTPINQPLCGFSSTRIIKL